MLWVADQLQKGQSVLWLLPTEAALRLRRRQLLPYLDQVDTFHGQLSAGKRGQLFSSVGCGETRLILGIRKCVFLPYPKLDVIFVEEDHQDQFKEQKSAFRYQRSTAIRASAEALSIHIACALWQEGRLSCYFRTAFEGLD